MKSKIFLAALITAALAQSPANATVSVNASLSNFNLILIDTNLNDGVSPYIKFNNFGESTAGGSAGNTNSNEFYGSGNVSAQETYPQASGGGSDSLGLVAGFSGVTGSISQNYYERTNQIQLRIESGGFAKGTNGIAGVDSVYFGSFANWYSGQFSISQNTMAILTATASINISSIDNHPINQYSTWEYVDAELGLGNESLHAKLGFDQLLNQTENKYQSINYFISKTFVTSYFNDNPNESNWQFGAYATTSGLSFSPLFQEPSAPTIPEPETYAMMLTGLFAVGIGARRGRRVGQLSDCRVSHSGNRLN
ncbi:MAG TPA: PEP-CTERM sorting domain-containing protein [Burkholderiaceae bacterium]|nr:PEP-CTERM sorting domain-containing protein [Burkholderiaceae bacterium]HMX10619.1 PEP-CTERM sorting domain-containing protein [Burkholderiaceae bacterium]HMY98525.1 PEP-CTERM sorting domain-containing protein [Burkholderiaceae bacterium]HNB45169.1 PEP-CTERM sorting domain-containing protein [Burkholderiaceae bacterium]HNG79694.1 PEP-CTERM sorting domain-containing protein [Burkholderiaceae bacterium]